MAARSVSVVPVTDAHLQQLAPHLRPADVAEVDASCGLAPLEALRASVAVSEEAWAGLVDGEVVAVFGVAPAAGAASSLLTGPEAHVVWLLTGMAVHKHAVTFARCSRLVLAALLSRYPALCNAVDARNRAALRWATWLGFGVGTPAPFGVAQLPFVPIGIDREAARWTH